MGKRWKQIQYWGYLTSKYYSIKRSALIGSSSGCANAFLPCQIHSKSSSWRHHHTRGVGGGRERERENMSLLSYFFIPITKQSWAILGLRLSNPRNMSESRSPFKPVSDSAHAGDPRVRISTLFFLLQKFKKNHGIPASQELNPCGGIAYRVAGVWGKQGIS